MDILNWKLAGPLRIMGITCVALNLQLSQAVVKQSFAIVGDEIRTVALSGYAAPGTEPGVEFGRIGSVILNGNGQAAVSGKLVGTGVTVCNDSGIWMDSGNDLTLVVRTGDVAPGIGSAETWTFLNPPQFNDEGKIAFRADVSRGGIFFGKSGIWSNARGTNFELLGGSGNQAPGLESGITFDRFGSPLLNNRGDIAFVGEVTNARNNFWDVIWRDSENGLEQVAKSSDEAPGTAEGIRFDDILLGDIRLNSHGQVAFRAGLAGIGVRNGGGVWLEDQNGLSLVARKENLAEDLGMGIRLKSVGGGLRYNKNGSIAHLARLQGNGITSANEYTVLHKTPHGVHRLIAQSANIAPGTEGKFTFFRFDEVELNDNDQMAIRARLAGPDAGIFERGIWRTDDNGLLELVTRVGDQAPGVADGVTFDFLDNLIINGNGQIAFVGSVTEVDNLGIWAQDLSGQLHMIAKLGQQIDVSTDPQVPDLRTISFLSLDNNLNGDGNPLSFNDLGQLAFTASFTDGTSGAFVSHGVAIPEPISCLLVAFATIRLSLTRPRVRRF